MPDILIFPADDQALFDLEKIGKEEGFRVKSALDLNKARDWLQLRDFDAMLIDSSCPLAEQQKLAGMLWQKNPLAHFVVYNFDSLPPDQQSEVRLFGADTAFGPRAGDIIRQLLKGVKPRGSLRSENFKVLVVEDLDSPRDIICAYLESLGFPKVLGVSSAKEAMAELEKNTGEEAFACILSDVRMPQVSGAQLIEMLRSDKRYANLPIIVLTAYGTVDCLVDCLRAGASGFLVKPPKRQDLVRELSRAIRLTVEGSSPRLAKPEEAELLRDLLTERGLE